MVTGVEEYSFCQGEGASSIAAPFITNSFILFQSSYEKQIYLLPCCLVCWFG